MATAPHMFAAVPPGQPSVRAAYEAWLKQQTPLMGSDPDPSNQVTDPTGLSVGIVGGGMAGLYAALVLRSVGAHVHVFESHPTRVGGRVYTHRFTPEPNQYFEAGAMRLPDIPAQQPVFHLIDYLNEQVAPDARIATIPYVLYDDGGNRVYVNGRREQGGRTMTVAYADQHPAELGFPLPEPDRSKTASALLDEVLAPFHQLLEQDFERGFHELMQYDDFSLRAFLAQVAGWSEAKINYCEVMTSQTNQFQNSFTELVIETMDFSTAQWKTIADGMDRLPRACVEVLGPDNVTMGAEVYELEQRADGRVAIHHTAAAQPAVFDKVIAAVPPAVLRMWKTPQWPVPTEHAIRALHFEPLYKIGLRFRTRFWERVTQAPSRGGQSISDIPSRWCVYPSYGIGDGGAGVLLLYSWMTDAAGWLPQSAGDRIRIALRDLQDFYPGEVDVRAEFLESFDVAWPLEWATGDAMFFPGQFRQLFNAARAPAGNVFFAGEHLSVHHTWIVGALDSALLACQQLLGNLDIEPLRPRELRGMPLHDYDYERCAQAPVLKPAVSAPVAASSSTPGRWLFGK